MRARGQPTDTQINRDYPHQIAVPLFEGRTMGYVNPSGPLSSLCRIRFGVSDGVRSYEIFCFGDRGQAEQFREAIKGEDFDSRDRAGAIWHRGRGKRRDASRARKGYW
ncbi:hypothetical protein ASE61_15175 [Bosea sp. Root670]|nr:hypothetical protein ASE61_15175 [Bosea sp. Root670]